MTRGNQKAQLNGKGKRVLLRMILTVLTTGSAIWNGTRYYLPQVRAEFSETVQMKEALDQLESNAARRQKIQQQLKHRQQRADEYYSHAHEKVGNHDGKLNLCLYNPFSTGESRMVDFSKQMEIRQIDVAGLPGTQWKHDDDYCISNVGSYTRLRWGHSGQGQGVKARGVDLWLHKARYNVLTDIQTYRKPVKELQGTLGYARLRRRYNGSEYDQSFIVGYAPQEPPPGPLGDSQRELCRLYWDTVYEWILSTPNRSRLHLLMDGNGHMGYITKSGGERESLSKTFPGTVGTAYEEKTNENGYCLAHISYYSGMCLINTAQKWRCGATHSNGHRLDY